MNSYCTLFDYNYLSFGLSMYDSLVAHSGEFHLYIFAFDQMCYDELHKLKLAKVTIIHLSDFEDKELLSIKQTRSRGEYCWTCTPSTILYIIEKFNVPNCTYIDADLYFFSDPSILIEEMGDQSILLTKHNYSEKYITDLKAGIYCVQFMTFKNDIFGLKALKWWREGCIKWCFAKFEDGKFGDQKYLDDWLTRFEKVHVLKNIGGGIAPWNVGSFKTEKKDDVVYINNIKSVFYHFHDFKTVGNKQINLCRYDLNDDVIECFYKPYIKVWFKYRSFYTPSFNNEKLSIKDNIKILKRKVHRMLVPDYNVYYIKELIG